MKMAIQTKTGDTEEEFRRTWTINGCACSECEDYWRTVMGNDKISRAISRYADCRQANNRPNKYRIVEADLDKVVDQVLTSRKSFVGESLYPGEANNIGMKLRDKRDMTEAEADWKRRREAIETLAMRRTAEPRAKPAPRGIFAFAGEPPTLARG